jgi:hypothetical protein
MPKQITADTLGHGWLSIITARKFLMKGSYRIEIRKENNIS